MIGIETHDAASELAREHLNEVFVGPFERTDLFYADGHFDCIVYSDALHRLAEPREVLRRHRRLLAGDGVLLARVPNRNYVQRLKRSLHVPENGGETPSLQDSLPDRSLHAFTREEIEMLFFECGFEVESISPDNPAELAQLHERPAKTIAFERTHIDLRGLSEQQIVDYFTPHFIVQARRRAEPAARRTVSAIVPVCNQIDITQQFVDSLLDYTPELHEIIFVDNGSNDGTPQFFDHLLENWEAIVDSHDRPEDAVTLSRAETPGDTILRVISNSRNIGMPGALNQGIDSTTGQYVVVLHNDLLFTEGWLDGLLHCAENAPGAAIVGPVTNHATSIQADPHALYNDEEGMHDYAGRVAAEHDGEWLEVPAVSGFCMLIRKDVLDIGGFDERFGYGIFEDSEFCLRARNAGYRVYVAGDTFVHHFGGLTFQALGVDMPGLFKENEQKFQAKLQEPPAEQTPQPAPEPEEPKRHGLALVRDEPDEPESYESLLKALLERGREAVQAGDFNAAFEALTKAVEHAPDNPEANNDLGWVSFRRGLVGQAEACWKRALQIEPANMPVKRNLADFYFSSERFADAITLYEELLINRAADFDVIDALGDAYLELHNYEGAVHAYELLDQSFTPGNATSPLATQTKQKLQLARKRQQECITV
ncbi:MAG: glycosyltransferase [Planctomycetota bacterium]|nr:glycosyltransferase [Planctomycetota bacterium]MDP7248063.1 glycosyltransferase [Planctomycetota bacterium]HJO83942.1 glycosyltransferase [SAR202 cluster bacterium]